MYVAGTTTGVRFAAGTSVPPPAGAPAGTDALDRRISSLTSQLSAHSADTKFFHQGLAAAQTAASNADADAASALKAYNEAQAKFKALTSERGELQHQLQAHAANQASLIKALEHARTAQAAAIAREGEASAAAKLAGQQVAQLGDDLAMSSGHVARLASQLRTAEEKVTSLEGQVAAAGDRVTAAEKTLAEANQRMAEAKDKVAAAKSEIDSATAGLNASELALSEASSIVRSKMGAVATAQANVSNMQEAVRATGYAISAAEGKVAAARSDVARARETRQLAEGAYARAQAAYNTALARFRSNPSNPGYQSALSRARASRDGAASRLAGARSAEARETYDLRGAEDSLATAKANQASLQRKLQEAIRALQEAQRQLEEAQEAERRAREDVARKKEELAKAKAEHEKAVAEQQAAAREVTSAIQSLDRARTRLADLEDDLADAQAALVRARDSHERAAEQQEKLEKRLAEAREAEQKAQAELTEAKTATQEARARVTRSQSEVRDGAADVETARRKLEALDSELDAAQAKVDDAKADHEKAKSAATKAKDKVAEAKEALTDHERKAAQLRDDLEAAKRDKETFGTAAAAASAARYQGMAVEYLQNGKDSAKDLDGQTSGADRKFFNSAQSALEEDLATATTEDDIHEIYKERYGQGGTYMLDGVPYRAVYNPVTRKLHLTRTDERVGRTKSQDTELVIGLDGTVRKKTDTTSGRRGDVTTTSNDLTWDSYGVLVDGRIVTTETQAGRGPNGTATSTYHAVSLGEDGQAERESASQTFSSGGESITYYRRTDHTTGKVDEGEVVRELPKLPPPTPKPEEPKGFWDHVGGFFKGFGEAAVDVGAGLVELWNMSRRSGINPVFLYDLATDPEKALKDFNAQWKANAGLVGGVVGTVGLALLDGVSQPVEELLRGAGQVFDSEMLESWAQSFDGSQLAARLIGDTDNAFLQGLDSGLEGEFAAALWDAVTAPIVDDWNAGNQGEAIGRGAFEVVGLLADFFTGGGTRAGRTAGMAGRVAKVADDLADAGTVARTLDNAADLGSLDELADIAAATRRLPDPTPDIDVDMLWGPDVAERVADTLRRHTPEHQIHFGTDGVPSTYIVSNKVDDVPLSSLPKPVRNDLRSRFGIESTSDIRVGDLPDDARASVIAHPRTKAVVEQNYLKESTSLFDPGLRESDLVDLVEEAVAAPRAVGESIANRRVISYEFDRVIGLDPHGNPTKWIEVVLNERGEFFKAFPGNADGSGVPGSMLHAAEPTPIFGLGRNSATGGYLDAADFDGVLDADVARAAGVLRSNGRVGIPNDAFEELVQARFMPIDDARSVLERNLITYPELLYDRALRLRRSPNSSREGRAVHNISDGWQVTAHRGSGPDTRFDLQRLRNDGLVEYKHDVGLDAILDVNTNRLRGKPTSTDSFRIVDQQGHPIDLSGLSDAESERLAHLVDQLDAVTEYLNHRYGIDFFADQRLRIVFDHTGFRNNAAFDSRTNSLIVGSAEYGAPYSPGVLAHEFGHGIFGRAIGEAGIEGSQLRALNEAVADIIGAAYVRDWKLFRGFDGLTVRGHRDIETGAHLVTHYDDYTRMWNEAVRAGEAGVESHRGSGVITTAVREIQETPGIGWSGLEDLLRRVLDDPYLEGANVGFSEFADALHRHAGRLWGVGSERHLAVVDALRRHGIPFS